MTSKESERLLGRKRKSLKTGMFVKLVVIPTAVSIAADIVVGVAIGSPSSSTGKQAGFHEMLVQSLLQPTAVISALASWIATQLLLLSFLYGADYQALEFFKRILSEFPEPVSRYARTRIKHAVELIDSEVRSLEHQGLFGQTFQRKMEIIESLIEHLGDNLTRFWATTLDSPSDLFEQFDRFFIVQAEKLKNTHDKRRIVILTAQTLSQEIRSKTKELLRFITWHQDNQFTLLFLVDDDNKFVTEAKQFLEATANSLQKEDPPVTDFAILGEQWVYGEAVEQNDSSHTRSSRWLRIFDGAKRVDIVQNYVDFYEALWNHWRGEKWPSLIAEQVVSECTRQKFVNTRPPVSAPTAGKPFFDEMIKRIAGARRCVIAVDIAPLKNGMSEWLSSPDYIAWLQATLDARKNGATVSRLHILHRAEPDGAVRKQILEHVFQAQLDAGCTVLLASAASLWQAKLPMHDFILIDDSICFSLSWDEEFSSLSISTDANLDASSNAISWYREVFNRLNESGVVKNANRMQSKERAHYLEHPS